MSNQLEKLQQIAKPAWPTPTMGDPPPTIEDLVQCLTNVAVNRLARIRELEGHIVALTWLHQKR